MPPFIPNQQNLGTTAALSDVQFDYTYPESLDLHPDSEQSKDLTRRILERARAAQDVIKTKYDVWNRIDELLNVYIPLDQDEKDILKKDRRKPVSFVVPTLHFILETLLTQIMSVFSRGKLFTYEGVGPEDVVKAAMLELVVDDQVRRGKAKLALYPLLRDAFAYGFGAAFISWRKEMGYKTGVEDTGFTSTLDGSFMQTGKTRVRIPSVTYEGSVIRNINPRLYLPDPNVPIADVQESEFVGWVAQETMTGLMGRENIGSEGIFNSRYLRFIDGRSNFATSTNNAEYFNFDRFQSGSMEGDDRRGRTSALRPIDVIYMYINLIPNDWGLPVTDVNNNPNGEFPEKWFFMLAGDQVILNAKPLGLDHNKYPIVVAAPTSDGYSSTNVSELEIILPSADLINFLVNSHVHNLRKVANDMIVLDPSRINIHDARNPDAGKIIRGRKAGWGLPLKESIFQLGINDITRNNFVDINAINNIIQRSTGASDPIQGQPRQNSAEVSAAEFTGVQSSALGRIEKALELIDLQAIQPIGFFFAAHTQQLLSQETYVRISGDWEEKFREDYGIAQNAINTQNGRLKVTPFDLDANFDVIAHDASSRSAQFAQQWVQLIQVLSQIAQFQPGIVQKIDFSRVFNHIARSIGAKDVDQFYFKNLPRTQNSNIQLTPDQQVLSALQQGQLQPANTNNGGIPQ